MRNKTGESLWLPDGWGWKVEMTTGLKIGFASSRQFNALSIRGQQRDVSTTRLFAEIRSLLTLTYEKQSRSDCSLNMLRQSPPWLVVKSGSSWKKNLFLDQVRGSSLNRFSNDTLHAESSLIALWRKPAITQQQRGKQRPDYRHTWATNNDRFLQPNSLS